MLKKLYLKLNKIRKKVPDRLLKNQAYLHLRFSLFSKRKLHKERIVFECNLGEGYYGGLRSLYEYLLSCPQYENFEFIWSVKKLVSYKPLQDKERTRLVKVGTIPWLKAFASSKYIITNKPVALCIKKRAGQCYILCTDELFDHGTARYPKLQWPVFDYAIGSRQGELLNRLKVVTNQNRRFIEDYTACHYVSIPDMDDALLTLYDTEQLESCLQNIRFKNGNQSKKIIAAFLDNAKEYNQIKTALNSSETYYWCKQSSTLDYYLLLHMADLVVTDNMSVIYKANRLKKECFFINRYGADTTGTGLTYTEVKSCFDLHTLLSIADYAHVSASSVKLYNDSLEDLPGFDPVEYYRAIGKNIVPPKAPDAPSQFDHIKDSSLEAFASSVIDTVDETETKLQGQLPLVFSSLRKKVRERLKSTVKQLDLRLYQLHLNLLYPFKKNGYFLTKNEEKLLSYKDKYKGQKCFLIGNGPSLTPHDLELIQDEYSFACNRIYKLFGATTWRPTFYCLIDGIISKYESNDIAKYIKCPIFTNKSIHGRLKKKGEIDERIIYSNNLGLPNYKISKDFFNYYIPSGATVMTYMIELAIYMGFEHIYLLGVDCTSGITTNGGHCVKNYVSPAVLEKDKERIRKRLGWETITNEEVAEYYFNKSTFAYRIIRDDLKKSKRHVTIQNATRGGMLEAYNRVALEDVV